MEKIRVFILIFMIGLLIPGFHVYGWAMVFDANFDQNTLSQRKMVSGQINGRILDYETQKPLAGVTVEIMDRNLKTQSDEVGCYVLPEVPVGHYVLSFQMVGYYPETRTDVMIRSSRITFVNVELFKVRSIQEEVSVTADYFSAVINKPGSKTKFNSEELRRNAGGLGVDMSRVLYNVPGVSKADEAANDLIIRGGSPTENGFYINNIFIPNINHFPQWGASGGNISMLNLDFVERVEVLTGGFEASFGNRLSSIVDIDYREGNREIINSQFNLSLLGFGAQIEGPLPGGKGSWMISGNRSYMRIINDLLDETSIPAFHDIQGKLDYYLNDSNRLSFLTLIGQSRSRDDPSANRVLGDLDVDIPYGSENYAMPTVGLNWRHLWGNKGYSDTSISFSMIKARDENRLQSTDELLEFWEYKQSWITFRNVNHLQLSLTHQLKFGFECQSIQFRTSDHLDSIEQKYRGTFGAGFFTYIVYPFPNFSLSSGVRLDYVPLSERTHISPRFSFSWALTKRLSINGAYGMFYQQMPLFLIKQHPNNVKLKDPQARHLVLGFKYLLHPDTQLKLEAYDKQYHHFPMSPLNPFIFIIDDVYGDYDKFMNWGNLIDTGKAFARGVELTLQKKLSKKFYGILNMTYYRARYQDLTGVWRNRKFDNRFIFCLSGGYKPTKNWEFNAQWIWSGNRAFSPVNEEKSKELGLPIVDSSDFLSAYLSNYQNLSIRVDRRFFFSKSNLVFFIGALNVLNHNNELLRYWDTWDNCYISEYMWGIIPYIGLEFEF